MREMNPKKAVASDIRGMQINIVMRRQWVGIWWCGNSGFEVGGSRFTVWGVVVMNAKGLTPIDTDDTD